MARTLGFSTLGLGGIPEKRHGVSRAMKTREKQHLHESSEGSHARKVDLHYGARFAETRERAHEERAYVEIPIEAKAERKLSPVVEAQRRGPPIGALPESEPFNSGKFQELWDEAGRYTRMLVSASRDVVNASVHLLRLPLEAARLAAVRLKDEVS